jgi:molybdopterin synthase sulfur carrier subunit
MVTVKFFASLRERTGKSEVAIAPTDGMTVGDLWAKVSGDADLGEGILTAVNHEYVDTTFVVKAGDEVAFFPPVTGG